ncbi:carnitine palmitoyltransferase 2 isoform X2 [Lycorma delicatula]|uniref:carnitine palmitoyltransferase 2 isoform X2 n=1 Tax=Lycorma delicatula TaxID=130591 RepID=UPI003F50E6D3
MLRVAISRKKVLTLCYGNFVGCYSSCADGRVNGVDQYIQRSKVPTYHFQKSLPRLPVPKLEDTCKRYLRAQKPILSEEDYKKTEKYIKDFEKDAGSNLQKTLKEHDVKNKQTSYISEPWFNLYLSDRIPLPVNYNPFLVFINDTNEKYNDQLVRASNLLISSLRFLKSLREKVLEPEVFHLNPKKSDTSFFRQVTGFLPSSVSWYGAYLFKAFPLDMSQYHSLFNSTRIPQIGKDKIFQDTTKRHIVVMKGGHFYTFDVLDIAGNIVSPSVIESSISYILKQEDKAEFPLGILTTMNRDSWAKLRAQLESTNNQQELNIIDTSLFNLCLDDSHLLDEIAFVRQYLHSDGINRWFDKSFSLIVGKNSAGINFEHSWGDGVAILRYFQDIHRDSTSKPFVHPNSNSTSDQASTLVKKLDFKLNDELKTAISNRVKEYKNYCQSIDINIYEFKSFGRNLCKVHQISPDSLMQLAFQVAYDRLHDKQVATYESCSTAAFKHGRTETMRPCTIETKEFCKALRSKQRPTNSQLKDMIIKCSKVHSQLIKEAAMGQGFDRHMFALRLLAEKSGLSLDVFKDPAYSNINKNILSTSTLTSDLVYLGGFGPVVQNGFGVGYSIWNERLGSLISNYKEYSDGSGFIKCLETSLADLYTILKDTAV